MSRPVVCPHCGEELDIPSELRGRDVRCASCRNIFTAATDSPPPPRATRAGSPASARTTARPTYDDDRAPWDELGRDVLAGRRATRKMMHRLMLFLGCGGLLVFIGCCGCGFVAMQIENPEFVTHESPKGRFVAGFPEKPLEAQRVGDDGLARECTESTRELILGTEETYFVHYRDLPALPATDDARQETLQGACERAKNQTPGTAEKLRTKTTVGTYPAVDLFLAYPDGTLTYVRFIVAGQRIYAVGLTAPGLQRDSMRLKKFLDAFQITSDDEKKK